MTAVPPLFVLAGGFGTRLRTAVRDVPKPLAPVLGVPYLHYLIRQWVADGVKEFVFLLHHQAELIEAFLRSAVAEEALRGCAVATVTESKPMGTGGAIAYAIRERRIRGTFLVANADTWLGEAISAVAAQPAPALGIVYVEDAGRYGSVLLDGEQAIGFEEKRENAGAGWINAGLYHLAAEGFSKWDGRPYSLERETLPQLAAGHTLRAARLKNEFIDIGVPEDYYRFCRWIETAKNTPL